MFACLVTSMADVALFLVSQVVFTSKMNVASEGGLRMQSYIANFSTGKKLGVSFPSLAKVQDGSTDIARE